MDETGILTVEEPGIILSTERSEKGRFCSYLVKRQDCVCRLCNGCSWQFHASNVHITSTEDDNSSGKYSPPGAIYICS